MFSFPLAALTIGLPRISLFHLKKLRATTLQKIFHVYLFFKKARKLSLKAPA